MALKDFDPTNFARQDCCGYTGQMGEVNGKDTAKSLFEPLPQDTLIPSANDKAPLNPQERKQAVEWLLSPNGGNVSVRLFKPYDNIEVRDLLIENMLLNSWFLPSPTLGNEIPLQAQSAHKVGSSTIPIIFPGETPMKVDVVVKPFRAKNSKAEDELEKLEKIRDRGIATVEPLGVIDINDQSGHDTFILTVLKKGILPVQKINFEQLHTGANDNYPQLITFLNDLSRFVAKMHDKGVVHGDLHIGNIALDMNQEAPNKFVVFDLEGGNVMAAKDLGVKNAIQTSQPESKMRKFKLFEAETVGDIANLAADIAAKNEHLSYDTILFHLVTPYLRDRRSSLGRLTENQFIQVFGEEYKKRYIRTRKIVELNRKKLINLAAETAKT